MSHRETCLEEEESVEGVGPCAATNRHLHLVMTVFNHQAKGFFCILSFSLDLAPPPGPSHLELPHFGAHSLSFSMSVSLLSPFYCTCLSISSDTPRLLRLSLHVGPLCLAVLLLDSQCRLNVCYHAGFAHDARCMLRDAVMAGELVLYAVSKYCRGTSSSGVQLDFLVAWLGFRMVFSCAVF